MSNLLTQTLDKINGELAEVFNNITDQEIVNNCISGDRLVIKVQDYGNIFTPHKWFIYRSLSGQLTELEKVRLTEDVILQLDATNSFKTRCETLGVQVHKIWGGAYCPPAYVALFKQIEEGAGKTTTAAHESAHKGAKASEPLIC